MKSNPIINLCFLIPFVFTTLNLQVLVTTFVSYVFAQIMAYGNLALIVLGIFLILKKKGQLSSTSRLWIIFYIMYFIIAIMAGVVHNNNSSILVSLIPFFYVLGFYYYLSLKENRVLFEKVAFIAFVISCFICIYWHSINFDLDKGGVHVYTIDRAQGVYGDANNMALTSILAFIFTFKTYNPTKKILKFLKLMLLGVTLYSLFITFSNTGFMVCIISIVILNYRFFSGVKIILGLILLPVLYLLLLNLNNITANMDLVGQQRDKINNIVNIVSFNFDKVDDSGRNDLINNLLYYVYENPIFGNGVDFSVSLHAHNTVIGVWADAGIFTLLFFLIMLGKYFSKTIASSPETRYFVLPVLIALCIFMLSLQSIINQPYLIALFIYLGYLIDVDSKKYSKINN